MGYYNKKNIFNHLLFYDIEVYKHDFLISFKTQDKKIYKIFHNHCEGLEEIVNTHCLVGYNNWFYDDLVLSKMIEFYKMGLSTESLCSKIKKVNDHIITGGQPVVRGIKYQWLHKNLVSLDAMAELGDGTVGLKQVQANLGEDIHETSVGFDIDRPLTPDEVESEIEYNLNDIDYTITVYEMREKSHFIAKAYLAEMVCEYRKYLSFDNVIMWTNMTLIGNLLGPLPEENKQTMLMDFSRFDYVPEVVKHYWKEHWKDEDPPLFRYTKHGLNYDFSMGGLHANYEHSSKFAAKGRIFHVDVTSMYPNLMILLGVFGDRTAKLKEILDERVQIKHVKELYDYQNTLKLIINGSFGILNNRYSKVYSKEASRTVCMSGQNAIYKLCEIFFENEVGILLQVNTDGVYIKTENEQLMMQCIKTWETLTGLKLEVKEYSRFIQSNINKYIGLTPDGDITANGIKTKGDTYLGNNNLHIINKAILEYYVNDTPLEETIASNVHNPLLYMNTIKITRAYDGLMYARNKNLPLNEVGFIDISVITTINSTIHNKDDKWSFKFKIGGVNVPKNVIKKFSPKDGFIQVNPSFYEKLLDKIDNLSDYKVEGSSNTYRLDEESVAAMLSYVEIPVAATKGSMIEDTEHTIVNEKYVRIFLGEDGNYFLKYKEVEDGVRRYTTVPNSLGGVIYNGKLEDIKLTLNKPKDETEIQIDLNCYYKIAKEQVIKLWEGVSI